MTSSLPGSARTGSTSQRRSGRSDAVVSGGAGSAAWYGEDLAEGPGGDEAFEPAFELIFGGPGDAPGRPAGELAEADGQLPGRGGAERLDLAFLAACSEPLLTAFPSALLTAFPSAFFVAFCTENLGAGHVCLIARVVGIGLCTFDEKTVDFTRVDLGDLKYITNQPGHGTDTGGGAEDLGHDVGDGAKRVEEVGLVAGVFECPRYEKGTRR